MTAQVVRLSDYRPRTRLRVIPVTQPGDVGLERQYAELADAVREVERAQAIAFAHVVRLWFMGCV